MNMSRSLILDPMSPVFITPREEISILEAEENSIRDIDLEINVILSRLQDLRGNAIYPLFMNDSSIEQETVGDVFDDLYEYIGKTDKLDVIVDSSGGDIHAAYKLALLFKRFARKELNFIVPRWAKSAATLLVCGGNKIYMGPIAELGPIDSQVTQLNEFEKRHENFSSLNIETMLDLIKYEIKNSHEALANSLLQRLQFPLPYGGIRKSLGSGKEYIAKLLTDRMFRDDREAEKKTKAIGQNLVEDYYDHGYCIDFYEARAIGLKVEELVSQEASLTWKIYKLNREKQQLEIKIKRDEKRKNLSERSTCIQKKIVF